MKATLIKTQLEQGPRLRVKGEVGTVFDVDITRIAVEFYQHKETSKIIPVPSIYVTGTPTGGRTATIPLELLQLESITETEMFGFMSDNGFSPEPEGSKYVN